MKKKQSGRERCETIRVLCNVGELIGSTSTGTAGTYETESAEKRTRTCVTDRINGLKMRYTTVTLFSQRLMSFKLRRTRNSLTSPNVSDAFGRLINRP